MNEFQPLLSDAGERRRERILDLALAEARGRRRRRALARTALTLAVVLVAVGVPLLLRSRSSQPANIAVKPPAPHPAAPVSPPRLVVTRIETDPHIIERLAIRQEPSPVVLINDNELLTELAMAHRPAGLAYVNGKATLLFR
ncbi:MAG TPA: hypothetical protein VGI81_05560 [Tepidisphaeraceae bacterium]|jgi:hypothetical protein